MRAVPAVLLSALLLIGCASRQERSQLESADFGLILLEPDSSRPLATEVDALFETTGRQLGALPERVRGWLSQLGPALQRLRQRTMAMAQSDAAALEQALAPYRTLGRYPIVFEQIKVPADQELAPVVIDANSQLRQAWRAAGALWLASEIEPLLKRELYRLSERDVPDRAALGVAAVSQLHLLLQSRQSSEGLALQLEQTQRLAALRLEVLQARLRAQPAQGRILRDDIQLLSALIQTLIRARTDLFEAERRLETMFVAAGDRVEAISKGI